MDTQLENVEQYVVCNCGSIIPDENIENLNKCNEFGEDYGVVTASCEKCGANHETSKWGEWCDFEEAKIYLQEYINT